MCWSRSSAPPRTSTRSASTRSGWRATSPRTATPSSSYDEPTIRDALERLARRRWVRLASGAGSRATKYRHLLDEALELDSPEISVLAVLMLRGPQTPGRAARAYGAPAPVRRARRAEGHDRAAHLARACGRDRAPARPEGGALCPAARRRGRGRWRARRSTALRSRSASPAWRRRSRPLKNAVQTARLQRSSRAPELPRGRVVIGTSANGKNFDLLDPSSVNWREALEHACSSLDAITPVYLPIVELAKRHACGYELLARFTGGPAAPPSMWFESAAKLGLTAPLERRIMRVGFATADCHARGRVRRRSTSPPRRSCRRRSRSCSLRASATTTSCWRSPRRTPRNPVSAEALTPFRAGGGRLAVDDIGSGFSTCATSSRSSPTS